MLTLILPSVRLTFQTITKETKGLRGGRIRAIISARIRGASRVLKSSQERGYRGQSPLTGSLGGHPLDLENQAASRPSAEERATWPNRRGTLSAAC